MKRNFWSSRQRPARYITGGVTQSGRAKQLQNKDEFRRWQEQQDEQTETNKTASEVRAVKVEGQGRLQQLYQQFTLFTRRILD